MELTRLLILLCVVLYCRAEDFPEVTTPLGKVRGYYKTSYEGKTFSAFEGIPYAKPPIGHLRFEEPQEAEPWKGVLQARNTYVCPQIDFIVGPGRGPGLIVCNEDCLYINVYTPRASPKPEDNFDVVVGIHGGAFIMGSGHVYTKPDNIMGRDLVFVSFNYRLGTLGFLSTQDEIMPGNNGLKDQTLALKWVQKYIKNFGGNPDSVTIDGFSAGAASVHYHYLSPLSKGLFHKGISRSGNAFSVWALQKSPLDRVRNLASSVGCADESSTKNMIECMKQRPVNQLITLALASDWRESFVPAVEKNSNGAFIADTPHNLLTSGQINDVPWINTFTTEDGALMVPFGLYAMENYDESWKFVAEHILNSDPVSRISNAEKEAAIKISEYYFGEGKLFKEQVDKLTKLYTDRLFRLGSLKASLLQNKVADSPIYTAIYGYKATDSFLKHYFPMELGVGHGDDILLLFKPFENVTLSTDDEIVKKFLLDSLDSYAKTGTPVTESVRWLPNSEVEELTYLQISGPGDISLKTDTHFLNDLEFWDSLPLKENEQILASKDEL